MNGHGLLLKSSISLRSLALLADPQPRGQLPRDVHDLPQTVATSHRSWLTNGHSLHMQSYVSHTPSSPQPNWRSGLNSYYFHLLLSGHTEKTLKGGLQAETGSKQSRTPGTAWIKRKESLLQPEVHWVKSLQSAWDGTLGATVDLGSKYKQEQEKIWAWAEIILPSRSRNFPGNIGGLSEQIYWSTLCGRKMEESQSHNSYYFSLYVSLFFFCISKIMVLKLFFLYHSFNFQFL